jgi:hypothetical protein
MAIDPSIALNVKPIQLANPLEQYMQAQQIQQAQNQGRLADLMYGEKQQQIARGNNLLNLMKGLPQDATDDQRMNTLRGNGYFDEADKLDTSIQNRTKTKAEAQKNQAEAMGKYLDATKQVAGRVMSMPTPENANAALNSMEILGKQLGFDVSGDIANERQALANLRTPDEIKQWAASHSIQADKMLPKVDTRNLGGTTDTISIDPVTGAVRVVNSAKNTQSPDNAATNARVAAEGAANRRKDFTIAGLSPDGTPGGEIETTAQAIAKGQLPPPSGMALMNPKNQRVLARVMEINPDYDYTTVAAKKKAASDFTSGPLGNALRSVSTANDHLDQLGELVDALGNGNTQIINKAKNAYLTATGDPAPTNFDAIKNIVGQEVVKAIVAGGGSMTEREEAAKTFSTASSPAQLKGAIQHYRMVMGAQADNLMEQRRAAGLPDSTLPNYKKGTAAAAPAIPATNAKGWTLHTDANGNRAYVSPDGKSYEEVK